MPPYKVNYKTRESYLLNLVEKTERNRQPNDFITNECKRSIMSTIRAWLKLLNISAAKINLLWETYRW